MLKTKMFKSITSMEESISNLILSTLMNGRVNQEKENSTKNMVSMLKDHSMLSRRWDQIDTLT